MGQILLSVSTRISRGLPYSALERMKEQCNKRVLLIVLIVILHLDAFFSMIYTDIAICLAVLAIVLWKRLWALFHAALLFGLFSSVSLLYIFFKPTFSTPLFYLITFISVGIVFAVQPARNTLSWMRVGRLDPIAAMLVLLTSLLSAAALLLWASLSDNLGAGLQMAQGIAHYPKGFVLLAGVPLFALLNALAEEVVFRGVLQQALMTVFRPQPAVILQAVAFAALHFAAGFPNGIAGYLMVLVYGAMLGYLRQRSSGMLAPYLTHVLADLVIGFYLCSQVFKIS